MTECTDAAFANFAQDRIRSGYWVYPSDELAAVLGQTHLAPPQEYHSDSALPEGIQRHPDRMYLHFTTCGRSTLELDPNNLIDCYPTEAQLETLDSVFDNLLSRYLRGPIAQFAQRYQKMLGWTLESFDTAFPEPGPKLSRTILRFMATNVDCWGPFMEDHQSQQHTEGESRHANGHSLNGDEGREERRERCSPVIEVVEDPETDDNPWYLHSEREDTEASTSATSSEYEDKSNEPYRGPDQDRDTNSSIQVGSILDDRPSLDSDTVETDLDPQTAASIVLGVSTVPCSLAAATVQNQPSILTNSNAKRKTPPPVDPNAEPANKRRSPIDRQTTESSASIPNGIGDADVDVESKDTLTPSFSEVSTLSTSEVESTPSDPTDPMPITPEDLPGVLSPPASSQSNPPKTRKQPTLEEQLALKKTRTNERTAYKDLPHIPSGELCLGAKTDKLIWDLLQRELEPMTRCGCRVCVRGKNMREMEEAQTEALNRVFEMDGNAGVMMALGLQ